MKKIIRLFVLLCSLSFANWDYDKGNIKKVQKGSWCSGKGSYSDTTNSSGIVRWHSSCMINGEEFRDVYVIYYGSNRNLMKTKIKDTSKIYFQSGLPIKYIGNDNHDVEGIHFSWRVNVFTFDGTVNIK